MDIMDTPLDDKVVQQLLATVLMHKLTSQQQNEDPLRQAQVAHMQAQTQGLKDANDPSKLLALLTGQGGDTAAPAANPAAPMAGATAFLPNGSYVSGSTGPGQAPGYTPPTEYNLGANPYAEGNSITRTSKGPSDPNADVIIRSKNPATGNPWFGNQLPEWASPEAKAAFNADRAGLPGTGETTARANSGPAAQGLLAGVSPQEMAKMMTISAAFDKHGMPAEVKNTALAQIFPWIGQQKQQEQTAKKQNEADIRKASAPAPAGTYLDENGQKYSPLYGGDVQPKGTFYRNGSTQAKMFDAADMVNNHVDATLEQLQGIAQGDSNRFKQLMSTKMSLLQNDPQVRTLIDTLGPASSMALGQAYAAGGTSMRGGVRMAEMFNKAFYGEGDTLNDSLNKMKTIEKLTMASAKTNNLHGAAIQNSQDRIDAIDALQKSPSTGKAATAAGSNVIEKTSKSGKPIVSSDGGATWSYK